jgi:hypothetical protein
MPSSCASTRPIIPALKPLYGGLFLAIGFFTRPAASRAQSSWPSPCSRCT